MRRLKHIDASCSTSVSSGTVNPPEKRAQSESGGKSGAEEAPKALRCQLQHYRLVWGRHTTKLRVEERRKKSGRALRQLQPSPRGQNTCSEAAIQVIGRPVRCTVCAALLQAPKNAEEGLPEQPRCTQPDKRSKSSPYTCHRSARCRCAGRWCR